MKPSLVTLFTKNYDIAEFSASNIPQDWSESISLLTAMSKWRACTHIEAYPSEWLPRLQRPALSFGASTNVTADATRRQVECKSGL